MKVYKTKEEAVQLLQTFNPSEQTRFARYPERCITGKAPTLARVRVDYGDEIAERWLVIEINDYNSFVGVKEENRASLEVMQEVARMIINRYYYLNLAEMMLFFQRLKYGDYGEMYGSVDSVRILKALGNFLNDRNRILEQVEAAERRKRAEEGRKNAITYEEYVRRKNAKGGADSA